jgi:hypothetical protein
MKEATLSKVGADGQRFAELARGCDAIARVSGVASGYGQRFSEGHNADEPTNALIFDFKAAFQFAELRSDKWNKVSQGALDSWATGSLVAGNPVPRSLKNP